MHSKFLLSVSLLFTSFYVSGTSTNPIISANYDDQFIEYLVSKMQDYSSWLQENKLDPDLPVTENLKLESYETGAVVFTCNIKNQQIKGHSGKQTEKLEAQASFEKHRFSVSRELNDSIEFTGDFDCTGKVNSIYFPELGMDDLPFSGQGRFNLSTNFSIEALALTNVGITDNYTLDFSQSYRAYANVIETRFWTVVGSWNESEILCKYNHVVNENLVQVYERFLIVSMNNGQMHLNPQYVLLNQYLQEITQDVDLRDILSDLPPTYNPTPSTPKPTAHAALPYHHPTRFGVSNNPNNDRKYILQDNCDVTTTTPSPTGNNSVVQVFSFHLYLVQFLMIIMCMWKA